MNPYTPALNHSDYDICGMPIGQDSVAFNLLHIALPQGQLLNSGLVECHFKPGKPYTMPFRTGAWRAACTRCGQPAGQWVLHGSSSYVHAGHRPIGLQLASCTVFCHPAQQYETLLYDI